MYEPEEDSWLLQAQAKKLAKGRVLDMGTGSGIQAVTAAAKRSVKRVLAVDINHKAIVYCRKKYPEQRKITWHVSELFSNIPKQTFDTIIFNPPYLPQERNAQDIALYGGKNGYEILVRFLNQVKSWLTSNGIVLVVFSSLTNKPLVDELIAQQLLDATFLTRKKIPWEELYVYKLTKNPILLQLQKLRVKNIKYLTKGKRGRVFTGRWRNKIIAIKIKRKESLAINRIQNEAKMLKKMNKHNIGPKYFFSGKNFAAYAFIPGEYLVNWEKRAAKAQKKKVLRQILKQCFIMDHLGLAKEEMTRPLKNAIVNLRTLKVTLIDFERMHKTAKPHNVTQFAGFAARVLKVPFAKLKSATRAYKETPNKQTLERIADVLGL